MFCCDLVQDDFIHAFIMMKSSNRIFFRIPGPFLRRIHQSPGNFPHKGSVMRTMLFLWAHIRCWINSRMIVDFTCMWRHRNEGYFTGAGRSCLINKFHMHLSHIAQCTSQNRNAQISALNGALCHMKQVHCGICDIRHRLSTREATINDMGK